MDIISLLSNQTYNSKLLTVSFNFNKVGFLLDIKDRLDKIITPDSCPMITNEDFIFSLFLPSIKKTILGKPLIKTLLNSGGRKKTYTRKGKCKKRVKPYKGKGKGKGKTSIKYYKKRRLTRKIKGGNRLQWQVIISFFFLLMMSLLSSSSGQLQLNTEEDYTSWKRSLIATRGSDTKVFQNDLGICSMDAYAAAGFFPITQYNRLVELQLGVIAYNFNKHHPQGNMIGLRDVQKMEIEEAANINIDAYRINIPANTVVDAYKLHSILLEGFARRFGFIEPGSYIVGTAGYSVIGGGGGHAVNIVYMINTLGEPMIEIIDLSEDDISEQPNPLQAIEYIQSHIKPNGRMDIYFSKQQSLENIPSSFKESINMRELEESVSALSAFPVLPNADEIINNSYNEMKEELSMTTDSGDIIFLKREMNNFLIKTYGSLSAAYPVLQGPLPKTIKTSYKEPPATQYF